MLMADSCEYDRCHLGYWWSVPVRGTGVISNADGDVE